MSDNITCPRCRYRHPADRSCEEAKRLAAAHIKPLEAERDALCDRLAECEKDAERLAWLETHLFDGKWDGTIGRPKEWYMAGPYRHSMQLMKGNTLREAIDAALACQEEKP